MTEYIVTVGFWLHAYDGFSLEADSDDEALDKARALATASLESADQPEHVDITQRRQGTILYIDRASGDDRESVIEDVEFDDDRIPLTQAAVGKAQAILAAARDPDEDGCEHDS